MKIIQPSVELYPQEDYTLEGIYKQIERCARVSYKSEDKITDTSSKQFVDNLIKAGHYAPLEFGTVYLKIPINYKHKHEGNNYAGGTRVNFNLIYPIFSDNKYSISKLVTTDSDKSMKYPGVLYGYNFEGGIKHQIVTTNMRVIVENHLEEVLQYLCAPTEYHQKRYCVKFTTDIGVAREFTRHRVFSFMQESTRYCNYSKSRFDNELTFICPKHIDYNEAVQYGQFHTKDRSKTPESTFISNLNNAEQDYIYLIEEGWKPQEARQVLPLATKTELVMCGFEDDWKHFFRLRTSIFAETGAPHPDMAKLADELYYKFKELNYIKMNQINKMDNFFLYKHTSPSGKVYIGITNKSPYYRWGKNGYNYLTKTKTGKYKHPKFASAILKYGWDNIKHEILYQNLDKNTACLLEQQYIREYKSKDMCYNLTLGGEGMWGFKFSEESLEKMRISHLGKKQSSDTITKRAEKCKGKKRTNEQKKKRSKPVVQYTTSGEKIAEYFGVREASRQTGISSAHIGDCCNERPNRKTAGGFIWKWKI